MDLLDWTLALDPAIPPLALGLAGLAAGLIAALGLLARRRGAALRALALALLVTALAGPTLVGERRDTLPGVVVLLTDRSASQRLAGREAVTEAARTAMLDRLRALPGIELREAVFDDRESDTGDGTRLFETLARSLADVAPERVSGVILLTDGQVHDVPASPAALGFTAPVHALLTGRPTEIDRRVTVLEAPRFGLVGKRQTLALRIDDDGVPAEKRGPVAVTVRRDGSEIERRRVLSGTRFTVDVDVPHAGDVVVEVEAEPLAGELTPADDRAIVTIRGIRENLRVLLVSGEPHPGERTWRNLLKSDASVDLVHFTILRPPEKQDLIPVGELALIAFPTRELFQDKLREFDLIVFDRYRRRTLLTTSYFDNIARWVKAGGAVLVAAGPDLAGPDGLFRTPLADVLPATPLDDALLAPFRPLATPLGNRHPVTADLPGGGQRPSWGRWHRLSPVVPAADAVTLMTGAEDRPLLLLARPDKGRVALLASDQVWLWARGHDGGGPHTALLRRLAHWLMKEPELEEEALRLARDGRDLVVERRTLADRVAPVEITDPTGALRRLTLSEAAPGRWRATTPADTRGLWRASDGTLTALAHLGAPDPFELAEVRSTDRRLAPLAAATGGAVRRLLAATGDAPMLPRVEVRPAGGAMNGSDWIGLAASRAAVSRGAERHPLAIGLLAAALLLAAFAAAWAREGR